MLLRMCTPLSLPSLWWHFSVLYSAANWFPPCLFSHGIAYIYPPVPESTADTDASDPVLSPRIHHRRTKGSVHRRFPHTCPAALPVHTELPTHKPIFLYIHVLWVLPGLQYGLSVADLSDSWSHKPAHNAYYLSVQSQGIRCNIPLPHPHVLP